MTHLMTWIRIFNSFFFFYKLILFTGIDFEILSDISSHTVALISLVYIFILDLVQQYL